ncbi:MAG: type II toxin-antitoxin system PemK/MazF family toxin [Bacteroidota bacterium]
MRFKQFEIWTADLSPQHGTEPGKIRPVLIVQSDLLNAVHPSTIICPLTTVTRKKTLLLRINLAKGQGGLNHKSAVMIDQLRAIDNRRLLKKIGDFPTNLLPKLRENIKIVLDLSV